MRTQLGFATLALLAGTACDRLVDTDPPHDGEPPVIRVESPSRGQILGDVSAITVTGTVTDAEGDLEAVTVNGVSTTVGSTGAFTVAVPATPGTNLVQVIATDGGNNTTTETRSVLAGPLVPTSSRVPDGLAAGISDDAFAAMGDAAAGFLESGSLAAMLMANNPVLDYGWSGPGDCLYGRGSITGITIDDAAIDLVPRPGGLALNTVLTGVQINMHLEYAAACINGSREITIRATVIGVAGDLNVGIAAGELDISLDNSDVTVQGLDLDLGGVPGAIVSLLSIDTAIGWILPWGIELFVAPMVGDALGGLGDTSVMVLGKQVLISVRPSQLTFDASGARVRLDSSIRVVGGDAGPGFVYVPNVAPDLATTDGFRIALADDVANQAFAGFWAAGGLSYTMALSSGEYGEVGILFDSVTIEALLPPSVRADGTGALAVVVGDLMATFERDGAPVTRIAINGTVDLAVEPRGTTGLGLAVGSPTVAIDILDDGITGGNAFADEEFEALISFAATRATHATAGLVGVIPLPAIGGVMLADVNVAATQGYVRVDGRLTR